MITLKKTSLVASLGLLLSSASYALPIEGSSEFTFSGVGQSDENFDNSSFGAEASYGYYVTDRVLVSARQNLSGLGDGDNWTGGTVAAVDYHFLEENIRPFVGLNAGIRYGGDDVGDDFSAGAQAGVKYYIEENAFFFVRADYGYTFDEVDQADDTWEQGTFTYTFGIGLNF